MLRDTKQIASRNLSSGNLVEVASLPKVAEKKEGCEKKREEKKRPLRSEGEIESGRKKEGRV